MIVWPKTLVCGETAHHGGSVWLSKITHITMEQRGNGRSKNWGLPMGFTVSPNDLEASHQDPPPKGSVTFKIAP